MEKKLNTSTSHRQYMIKMDFTHRLVFIFSTQNHYSVELIISK
jgi:hypothetical protein